MEKRLKQVLELSGMKDGTRGKTYNTIFCKTLLLHPETYA